MTRPIVAVIPTVGASPVLHNVVRAVMNDVKRVILLDNWPSGVERPWPAPAGLVRALHWYIERPDVGLYALWNEGFRLAQEEWPGCHVLFLNDDLSLPEGLARSLSDALELHPRFGLVSVDGPGGLGEHANYSHGRPPQVRQGTYRQGGVHGHAFMVRTEAWPEFGIDERFRIWFGDDDLVWKMRARGWDVGVLPGLVCGHATSTTVNAWPGRDELLAEDRRLWEATGRP